MNLYLFYIKICKDLISSIYSSIKGCLIHKHYVTCESLTSICLTSIHYTICVFIPPYLFPFYTSHSCSKPCNLSKRLQATCHGLYFHNLYVVKHFIHVFVRANGNKRKIMRFFFATLFCPRVCLALTHTKRTEYKYHVIRQILNCSIFSSSFNFKKLYVNC